MAHNVSVTHRLLPIVTSAAMLQVAFFIPVYAWWLVFVFLVPLFCVAWRGDKPLTFRHGFLWGSVFFGGHWYGLIDMIIERGASTIKYGLCFFLIIYTAAQAGVWFWLATTLSQKGCKAWWYTSLCWIAMSYVYFVWLWHGMFFIMGELYGYCFGLILLPLAEYPLLLSLLTVSTPYGLLACQVGIGACFSLMILRSKIWLFPALVLLLPFGYGYLQPREAYEKVSYYEQVGYVRPPVYRTHHWLDCAQELSARINELLERRPNLAWVLMPESTYPFYLNTHPQAIELLTDFERNSEAHILVGAYKKNGQCLFNSLYVLSDNTIKSTYDKTSCVPFVEYIPRFWCQLPGLSRHLFKGYKEFSPHKDKQGAFAFCTTVGIPYICSDLFLQEPLYLQNESALLLLCVNESWFKEGYITHMMYLFAKYYALVRGRTCCYVSHRQAQWIDKYGNTCKVLE